MRWRMKEMEDGKDNEYESEVGEDEETGQMVGSGG